MNFINLTNGIVAIKEHNLKEYSFIRIQSTWCEQKRWEDIIFTLSDDFLMNVALGKECVVYDYGSNKEKPRAIWQGLEWIKYVLNKRFRKGLYCPVGRAESMTTYFYNCYENLNKRTLNRLDYYRKFSFKEINIKSVVCSIKEDQNLFYREALRLI